MKNTILRKAMLFVLMVPMLFLASCIEEYNLPELLTLTMGHPNQKLEGE